MSILGWSNLLLWLVTVIEVVMIVAILRELSLRTAGKEFVSVGGKAPDYAVVNLDGSHVVLGRPDHLVFFISVSCRACEHLLRAWVGMNGRVSDVDRFFVVRGSIEEVGAVATANGLDPQHVIADPSGEVFRTWGIRGTPQVVVLDAAARVREIAQPRSRAELEGLLSSPTTKEKGDVVPQPAV